MTMSLTTLVRAVLLAAALALAVGTADARFIGTDHRQTATARTAAQSVPAARDGTTVDGVLLIAGIVAALILFAWVCSRVGDTRRPTM